MNATQTEILRQLGTGPKSGDQLAYATGVKQPSVRRSIQDLRRAGWEIAYGTTSFYSTYTLHKTPAAAAAEPSDVPAFDTGIDSGDSI